MSDESKKIEKIEKEAKGSELSDKEMDQVSGGANVNPATTASSAVSLSWETHEIKV